VSAAEKADAPLEDRARELGVRPESLRVAQERQQARRSRRAEMDAAPPAERLARAAHWPNNPPVRR
jgi:CO/xanthine dehydrogenase Mo-binding subunit